MTSNSNEYNKYVDLPHYSYKLFEHLMANNEMIWKLLYYNTPDAWNQINLTSDQKGALIWAGEGKSNDFRCFLDDGQPDSETSEVCQLRIYPFGISPENPFVGTISFMIEVYCHNKINTLTNYTTRVDTIIQQILETFNGIEINTIGSIGKFSFDKRGLGAVRMETSGQIPFRGKWLLMSNKSATS